MNHNPRMLRQRPSFAAVPSLSFGRGLSNAWLLKALTVAVWACVAFSAVSWGLRWSAGGQMQGTAMAAPQVLPDVDTTAAARSLGALPVQAAAAPSVASRFQLIGVLDGGPNAGAALIAVDGKPAKPFRVGAVVADGLVLQSTEAKRVSLGAGLQGPSALTLDLPAKK
jgi:general secretion pathway protein C